MSPAKAPTEAAANAVLEVARLTKTYGEHTVLDSLDLTIGPGEAVALIGSNGSGKTTALRCIIGLDEATSGTVTLLGRAYDERDAATRRAVATVLDDIDFFPDLSVVEHLDLLARAHGIEDPEEAVDQMLATVGLVGQSAQLPGTLSSGQRQRLGLASAFVRPRRLLVLDEPEQRLDAAGLTWLAERLNAEKAEGLAVLFASHDPVLVESVATRVVDLTP